MELTDAVKDEITEAIYAGRKIEAIKRYREATGQGLREAKEFIEALSERLRQEQPDRFATSRQGCGATVVLWVLLAVALLTSSWMA